MPGGGGIYQWSAPQREEKAWPTVHATELDLEDLVFALPNDVGQKVHTKSDLKVSQATVWCHLPRMSHKGPEMAKQGSLRNSEVGKLCHQLPDPTSQGRK